MKLLLKYRILTMLTAIQLFASVSQGQLIVDATGPRDIFFTDEAKSSNGLPFNLKLDTASKSISGYHFFPSLSQAEGNGSILETLLFGLSLKLTAVDGLDQVLNRWPESAFSGLINYTHDSSASLWSSTLKLTGSYGDFSIYDNSRPANAKLYSTDFLGGTAAQTFSIVPAFAPDWSCAISAGFQATNNYLLLPQVTVGSLQAGSGTQTVVGSGKVVRFGTYREYNDYPFTLLVNYAADWQWFDTLLSRDFKPLGIELLSKDYHYKLFLSPYTTYSPAELGRPADSVGLNFVLRKSSKTPVGPGGVKSYSKEKVTYPVSIFVDRENAFLGKPSTTVGAALTYHFP
jgi:hypothetical protein